MVNGKLENSTNRPFLSGRTLIFFSILTFVSMLFILLVAWPADYYFLNDDFIQIPQAASGQFLHGTLFRPFSDLTLLADFTFWNKNAAGYHLSNLLFHLADSGLVYLLAHKLFRIFRPTEDDRLKSLFISLLFLVYGSHSEPVLWIIGRGATLGALFFLPAVYFYLLRRNSVTCWMLSLLFFTLALLTYESVWIFPLVAVVLSLAGSTTANKETGSELKYPASVFGIFLLLLLCRIFFNGSIAGGYELQTILSGNISRMFYHYNTLLARTVLPPMQNGKSFLVCYLAVFALLAGSSIYLFRSRKAGKFLLVLICLFLLSPLPVISLGIDTHDSESERFIYLSTFFFLILLVEILHLLVKQKNVFISALSLLMIFQAYQFYREAKSYRDAGKTVKSSIGLIHQNAAGKKLYVLSLPTQSKGALMFRMHNVLISALNWTGKYKKTDSVIILSNTEFPDLQVPLQFRKLSVTQVQEENIPQTFFEPGPKQLFITGPGGRRNFESGKDILFYWERGKLTCIE